MGMDLTGLKPTAEAGVYFRNNALYWTPLWNYVAANCSDILTPRDVRLGSSNEGHRISRVKALGISERLQQELKSGNTAKFSENLRARSGKPQPRTAAHAAQLIASALGSNQKARFSVANVREFAIFCGFSGGFVID
jgi:hypothetical protein